MNELFDKYIKSVDLRYNNFVKPFIIGFIGLNGSGKTTIVNRLTEVFHLPIISSDHVRRFLNKHGIPGVSPNQKLTADISMYFAKTLCNKKISFIIDADLILPKYYHQAMNLSRDSNYDFYLIQIVCDEQVILQRIKDRQSDSDNLSQATIKIYQRRKKIHQEQKLPNNIFYKLDTSGDYEEQFQELVRKIKLKIK